MYYIVCTSSETDNKLIPKQIMKIQITNKHLATERPQVLKMVVFDIHLFLPV